MLVFKSTYDDVVKKLDEANAMNKQLRLEVQRLSEEISAQNTNCHVGAWCKDCAHVKHDEAIVKQDTRYPDPFGYYSKSTIDGKVIYCGKHLHDLCPEHSAHTTTAATEKVKIKEEPK